LKILLRKIEGANVALFQSEKDSTPELLPTRYDLFKYRGGVAWGYKGSGAQNLSYAIAARFLEYNVNSDIDAAAQTLLNNLVSKLNGDLKHDISFELISKTLNESVFDGAEPLYNETSVQSSQVEDMKHFLLKMAKELNLDEGHTFPIRLLMTKMTRMNPKEKEAIEPAFDSLVIDGIFEKRDDSYFLTENGKNTIY
jgi:hypothetical protein